MHVVNSSPEREIKTYLHCGGQCTRVFANLEALCEELSLAWIEESVGLHYGSLIKIVTKRKSGLQWDDVKRRFVYKNPEEFFYREAEFIIRTEQGEKLTAEELQPIYWEIRGRRWKKRRYGRYRHGRKTECCYGTFRHPKTNNERRQAFQNKDEGEPPIKPRRNHKSIITAWDDRYSHCDANWKTQSKRRRQYRPL